MALLDMMRAVLEDSGLLALWHTLAPWLALDERQLIFMVATPSLSVLPSGSTGKSVTTRN